MVHDDILASQSAARVFAHQIPGMKQMEEFGSQTRGSGTGDERFYGAGTVTGFL